MKPLICIAACLLSITGYAQTKLIAFRSHSGSNAHFRTAVEKDLFDIGQSNFGIIEMEEIDSVVMESKNRIIVSRRFYGSIKGYKRDTLTRANGREFFAATNVQMLKGSLHKKYRKAMLDNTHFIGFDNKFKQPNNVPKK